MENQESRQMNLMMTSHEEKRVRGPLHRLHKYVKQGYKVLEFNHTHPYGSEASSGDNEVMSSIRKHSPNAKSNIRFRGKKYPF